MYNNGHININVFGKGGRSINVYREKNDKFVVTYSLSSMSNSEEDFRRTTIYSKVLEKYFIKWEKET